MNSIDTKEETFDGTSKEETFDGTSKGMTFDSYASKEEAFDTWWAKDDLRFWDDSKAHTSEPWWSKEKEDVGASGGWQKWNIL